MAIASPDDPGPCTVTSQVMTINGELETHFYFPSSAQCSTEIAAPYPGVAFAHGFSMFGLSDGAAENAGNGEHLASWGYVVAIPKLPDDAEERITDMQSVVSFLETAGDDAGSFLYQKIDPNRLSAVGYSLGGATVLALAAHDTRIKSVVGLDPVYHSGGPGQEEEPVWDLEAEGPDIVVPTGILGSPAHSCNSDADYAEIYPVVSATHKAQFLIVDASHCDFADPGNSFCSFTCGATDPAKTQLSQKYMTAWLNYYMYYNTDYYTYLYGPEADSDIASDLIEREVDTAPLNMTATGQEKAVLMAWTLYDHPIVAGYNIYRRLAAEAYPDSPQISTGPTDHHLDEGLAGSETYYFVTCSRDPAGNEHRLSTEIHATTLGQGPPDVTPTPPPDETPVPEPQDIKVYLPCILENYRE